MTSLTPHYRGRGGCGGRVINTCPRSPSLCSAVPLFGRPFDRPDTKDLISTSPAPARLRRGGGGVTLGWFYCWAKTGSYLLLTVLKRCMWTESFWKRKDVSMNRHNIMSNNYNDFVL